MSFKVKNKQERNVDLENKFHRYLYRGDYERCKNILKGLNAEIIKEKK